MKQNSARPPKMAQCRPIPRVPRKPLGWKKIALRGGGGGTEAHFPNPPPSLLGRRDGRGGVQGGGARPAVPGGGRGVNTTSMAQNDTHLALIILTTQMWGGKLLVKKIFGPNFCVPAPSAPTSVLTQNKGPDTEPHFSNPPPPSAGVHVPPPPPRRAIFRLPCQCTQEASEQPPSPHSPGHSRHRIASMGSAAETRTPAAGHRRGGEFVQRPPSPQPWPPGDAGTAPPEITRGSVVLPHGRLEQLVEDVGHLLLHRRPAALLHQAHQLVLQRRGGAHGTGHGLQQQQQVRVVGVHADVPVEPERGPGVHAPVRPGGGEGGGGGRGGCGVKAGRVAGGLCHMGGVFAQRYVVYPGSTPANHPPTEACIIHSKLHRGCGVQVPGTRGYRG